MVISIVVSEISIVSFGVDWESLNSQKAEQTPRSFNESPRQRSCDMILRSYMGWHVCTEYVLPI